MIYVGPLLAASGASGPLAPILLGVGSAFMGLRGLLGGGGSDPQRAVNEFNKYLRDNGIDPGNTTMEDYERLMRRLSIAGPLVSPWGSPLYDLSGNMNPEHPEYRSQQGSGGIYGEDLNTQYGGVDRPPYWDYETGQWTIPVDVVSSGQDAVDRWMQRWGPWVAGGAAIGAVGGALAGGGTGAAPAPPEPPVTPEPETPIHQPGDPQLQDPSQRGQRPPSTRDDPTGGGLTPGQIGAILGAGAVAGATLPRVSDIRIDATGQMPGEHRPPPIVEPPMPQPVYVPDTGVPTFHGEGTALPDPPNIGGVRGQPPYVPPIVIPPFGLPAGIPPTPVPSPIGTVLNPPEPLPPVTVPPGSGATVGGGGLGLPGLPGGFPGLGGGDGFPAGAPQPPGFIGNIGGSKTFDTLMRMQYEPQFVPSLGYFLGRGGR